MPIAAFPSVAFTASPFPMVIQELTEESQIAFTEYDDGGVDSALQAGGVGIKRWRLVYDALTTAEAATLDAHALLARLDREGRSAYTFTFTDRAGVAYTGVRYQGYERASFANKNIQARTVILARYP